MKLKAVDEYKEPTYSKYIENKNIISWFIMNCKKVNLMVYFMFLICSNKVFGAAPILVDDEIGIVGGSVSPSPFKPMMSCGKFISYFISITLFIYTIVSFIKNRKIEDAVKKIELKRKYKHCIIWAIVLPVIFTLLESLLERISIL